MQNQHRIEFVKYHSLENDFIILCKKDLLASTDAQMLCHRQRGIGADGIILYAATEEPDQFTFLVQNADGSDGGFSGNGARSLAAYLFAKYNCTELTLKIKTKELFCFKEGDLIGSKFLIKGSVEPRSIILNNILYQAFLVDVGNPHLLFYNTFLQDFFLDQLPQIKAQLSSPCNISFIEPRVDRFFMRTDERGVGLTRGCSSAALAFLTLFKSNYFKKGDGLNSDVNPLEIEMLGGLLKAFFENQSLLLHATASFVFEGSFAKNEAIILL